VRLRYSSPWHQSAFEKSRRSGDADEGFGDVGALFGRERREWSPSRFWRAVKRHGEFFATMPWLPEGRTLWRAIGGHATILTALPRTDQEKVRAQKVASR
jgi:hypothetical protein